MRIKVIAIPICSISSLSKEVENVGSVYLDHGATTPLHPDVLSSMMPYFTETFGNPSSLHRFGQKAKIALDEARKTVAEALGAHTSEIVFTGGGTEADNLALIGVMESIGKGHLITSQIEHHGVLHTCEYLASRGFAVTYLPVGPTGKVNLEDVRKAIRKDTVLISIMYGNNETGVIQPVREIGEMARKRGIYFHTDAVQALGVESLDVKEIPLDLLSITAHKINGPKGVGALYVKKGVPLSSVLHGGSQEKKRRAGTENLPGIVGFAKAIEMTLQKRQEHREQYLSFRSLMIKVWKEAGLEFIINGDEEETLPHILNVSFPPLKAEALLMNLDLAGIAASGGSACTAGSLEPSHVLLAMGLSKERIDSAIRFSFGWSNNWQQIQEAAEKIAKIVQRLKK